MTLNEWIEANGDKEIEFEDGKIVVKEKPKSYAWVPEEGNDFWYIDVCGDCATMKDCLASPWLREGMLQVGNAFPDEQSAQQVAKQFKFRRRLQELGVKPRTNGEEFGWMAKIGDLDIVSPFGVSSQKDRDRITEILGRKNIEDYILSRPLDDWGR